MNRRGLSGTGIVSRLLLIICLCVLSAGAIGQSDRQAKEAELQRLREKITLLRKDLDKVRNHFDSLRAELGSIEKRIGELTRSLGQLDEQLREQQRLLAELHSRQQALQITISEQRDYLSGQVRAAYMMGRQEYFKILLNQEDPAKVGRMITYYDYLNRARFERIRLITDSLHELENVRERIVSERERLSLLRERQAGEKRQLQSNSEEREVLIVKLKAEISSKDKQLGSMLRDEKELQALIKAITEMLADIPPEAGKREPFARLKGKLAWPTRGPLLVKYGSERNNTELRWQGVMIKSSEGRDVKAISHGRVAFADWLRGYGLLVIIDHGEGYMSLYGHNQTLYKETGDWVESGDVIAAVGNSGGNDRTALYFEIRKDGQPTNPQRWLKK